MNVIWTFVVLIIKCQHADKLHKDAHSLFNISVFHHHGVQPHRAPSMAADSSLIVCNKSYNLPLNTTDFYFVSGYLKSFWLKVS